MITEAEVESARREWEDGHRRLLEQTRDATHGDRLLAQVDAVAAELRRRVGGVFTLAGARRGVRPLRGLEPRGRVGAGCGARLAADALARRGRRVPPVRARRPGLSAVTRKTGRVVAARSPSGSRRWRPFLVVLGVLAALLVGISLGRALEDGPSPGGTQTSVRTLQPQPLPPACAHGHGHRHDRLTERSSV